MGEEPPCPVGPEVLGLILDPTANNAKPEDGDMQADVDEVGQASPDGSPDPVLIRDVLVPKDGIGCLLVDHDADVPGVGALHLVQVYRCTVVQLYR